MPDSNELIRRRRNESLTALVPSPLPLDFVVSVLSWDHASPSVAQQDSIDRLNAIARYMTPAAVMTDTD